MEEEIVGPIIMEYRNLEVTLISAKDLKKVSLISKMDVYVVVTIEGGGNKGNQKTKTPVSNDGDTNPSWNCTMNFTIDEILARQNRLILVYRLRCERALGDKDIGEVNVPVKELLELAGGAAEGKPQFVTYQVRKPSGKPKGQLNFSYKLGEKVSRPGYTPPPAGYVYGAPAPAGAAGYTPPPAGYPHGAPAPAAAAGYPPPPPPPAEYVYGYPPPPPYGGYPPAGAYGYPPQPGYGYQPVQQPPKKNKNKMGLRALGGLLGRALGGLLIGEVISDGDGFGGDGFGGEIDGFGMEMF